MKKFSFIVAMLAITLAFGLALASCDSSGDSGSNGGGGGGGGASTLTITDIPAKFNGKYIYFQTAIDNVTPIFGCESMNMSIIDGMAAGTATAVLISNGRADLPLWRLASTAGSVVRYNGNGTTMPNQTGAGIVETSTLQFGSSDGTDVLLASIVFSSITFSNGGATVSVSEGYLIER